jgi:hypothetical protein
MDAGHFGMTRFFHAVRKKIMRHDESSYNTLHSKFHGDWTTKSQVEFFSSWWILFALFIRRNCVNGSNRSIAWNVDGGWTS